MARVNLSAQSRSGAGKGVARKLRAQGRIPVVLYGATVAEPVHLSMDSKELRTGLSTSAGKRVVINLSIDQSRDAVAILRELQRDPVTHNYVHADLVAIDLTKPIEIQIPIHGEGTPPGVKLEGGVLEWSRRDVTVSVLPTQIPESITIDLSKLHLNQSIHVSDLQVEGATILDDPEVTICSVASVAILVTDEEVDEGEAAEVDAEAGKQPKGE